MLRAITSSEICGIVVIPEDNPYIVETLLDPIIQFLWFAVLMKF